MSRILLGFFSLFVICGTYADDADFSPNKLTHFPSKNWITNGGNIFNQRYSPLTEITTDNVANLKGVWHTHLNGSGVGVPHSGEAQPIIYNGIIYTITGANDVFAVSVDTGDILWVYEPDIDPNITTLCCSWTSRGVGIGDGKIFIGQVDGKVIALDLKDGSLVWSIQAEHWRQGFTITSAPLFYDGLVITGFGGAEYGVRGRVKAFDANDGSLVWTFYTVPAPGEPGHETWPADSDIWQRGGATVWHTPAVDPELGLIYFATANPGPDFNGGLRKGDNLYSVSIVALDVKTGTYRWHFQEVHHDLWDYDAATPVVLVNLDIDGKARKAIAHAGKTGWVYILDRTNGEPLIGIEEKPVPQEPRQFTAPTQPYPIGDAFVPQEIDIPMYGYSLVNQGRIFTPFWKEIIPIKPSTFGGTTWAPTSIDIRSQTMYICGIDHSGLFVGGEIDGTKPEEQFLGGEFIFPNDRTGIFAAIDLTTNRLRWRHRWEDSCYSGSTATAGNLVFTGKNDGRFIALDSRDGSALWEFQTGAGVNAPPAVFEHDGKQHVLIYAAGAMFAQSKPGDSLWLFSLDGTLEELSASAGSANSDLATASSQSIDVVYKRNCGTCHGMQGQGGHGGGPALAELDLASDHVLSMIANGNDRMPGFGEVLSFSQVHALTEYVTKTLPSQ